MLVVEVKPPVGVADFGNRAPAARDACDSAPRSSRRRSPPSEPKPADFDAFWAEKLRQLAKVPVNPVVKPGESDRAGVEWSTVRLDNVGGSHVYGQLAEARARGEVSRRAHAAVGEPAVSAAEVVGHQSRRAGLSRPRTSSRTTCRPTCRRRSTTRCRRSSSSTTPSGSSAATRATSSACTSATIAPIEYLASRPDWDGKTIVVMGTSMGGQQSFVAAGLNPRVTASHRQRPRRRRRHGDAARALGELSELERVATRACSTTARYFDTANFASRITARSLVAHGLHRRRLGAGGRLGGVQPDQRAARRSCRCPTRRTTISPPPRSSALHVKRSAEWLDAIVHGRDPM